MTVFNVVKNLQRSPDSAVVWQLPVTKQHTKLVTGL